MQETFRHPYGKMQAAGASVRAMNYVRALPCLEHATSDWAATALLSPMPSEVCIRRSLLSCPPSRPVSQLCVMNTKVLFKHIPRDRQLSPPQAHTPAMAHMNYHPEKEPRMQATIAYYRDHITTALAAWNGGEGRNTGTCKHKVGVPSEAGGAPLSPADTANHSLVRNLLRANRSWGWGASHHQLAGPVWFNPDGALATPWGAGTWGTVAGPWRRDALHVDLHNATYLLMFLSEKWAFVAVRCSDEVVSYGRLRGDIPESRLVW